MPTEIVRRHLLVGTGNAGRISTVLFSLEDALGLKTTTALIAAEKLAATEHSVACRVDSAVTAMVVRADNS